MASRVEPSQVLDHPLRKALLATIRATPGIAFLELYHQFKRDPTYAQSIGYGSLTHHLVRLERCRLITTRKSGRYRRHYENGGPWNADVSTLALLQIPTAAQLARLILAEPGQNQAQLWRRMGRKPTRQAVGYMLQRLAELGLATVAVVNGARHHYGTERLQRILGFVEAQKPAGDSSPAVASSLPVSPPPEIGAA